MLPAQNPGHKYFFGGQSNFTLPTGNRQQGGRETSRSAVFSVSCVALATLRSMILEFSFPQIGSLFAVVIELRDPSDLGFKSVPTITWEHPLFMGNQILVCNRFEAEEFEHPYSWACISIANSVDELPEIHTDHRVALLQLTFADITQPVSGFPLFCDDHAHDILDFVTQNWHAIDTLLVHCYAGISRSSAVAAAISRLKFGDEGEFLDSPYDPNPRVYRILREVATGRADYEEE